MKKIFLLCLILVACSHGGENIELQKQMVMKTDQDFSQMSIEKGMNAAFKFYAADEVVLMRDGAEPLYGKNELTKHLDKAQDGSFQLTWVPIKADVSGEIGYTFGKWNLKDKASGTSESGVYVTIWKKQKDGTWRYVLDGGNTVKKAQ